MSFTDPVHVSGERIHVLLFCVCVSSPDPPGLIHTLSDMAANGGRLEKPLKRTGAREKQKNGSSPGLLLITLHWRRVVVVVQDCGVYWGCTGISVFGFTSLTPKHSGALSVGCKVTPCVTIKL